MPQPQRVSIERIVAEYRSTGSVWKAAKNLGIVGQSVWERLKAIDYPMASRMWTQEEYDELKMLSNSHTISSIAASLGRPYYAIAIKMSRLGLARRYGNTIKRKIPRGAGFDKVSVQKMIAELGQYQGTMTQFCRMKAVSIDTFVNAIQQYDPLFWSEYSQGKTGIMESTCPYCQNTFHPMNARQKFCTRKCSADAKRDEEYFGGRRRDTIGLAEGVCQLCLQFKPKRMSSHHLLGKENDPDNLALIALCPGCHQLVGTLAGRKFVDSSEGWENLIQIVMARRMIEKSKEYAGVYAYVEFEHLTKDDIESPEDTPCPPLPEPYMAWKKSPRSESELQLGFGDELCKCKHSLSVHEGESGGFCHVDGCTCRIFSPVQILEPVELDTF